MKYVIELLQRELLFETQCREDAIEFLNGGRVSPIESARNSTFSAFVESKRLAEERIVQIDAALKCLTQSDHP